MQRYEEMHRQKNTMIYRTQFPVSLRDMLLSSFNILWRPRGVNTTIVGRLQKYYQIHFQETEREMEEKN